MEMQATGVSQSQRLAQCARKAKNPQTQAKPTLVVMAAGAGSRFGGVKQMAAVDDDGHAIIDYSIYDAVRAGFGRIVFVVSEAIEKDFRERIGDRAASIADVRYALQRLDSLPDGYAIPTGRTKPWGTAHATLAAKAETAGPFAVINADDFYGSSAFNDICDFLRNEASAKLQALVGYRIENTLTENGSVARGICRTSSDGYLVEVVERTRIEPRPGGAAYIETAAGDASAIALQATAKNGHVPTSPMETETFIPNGAIVSMNMWGFSHEIMGEIERRFPPFLDNALTSNPLKAEYFLPLVPNQLLKEGATRIKTLMTPDRWYGVTYASDLPAVKAAIHNLREQGKYPKRLF